MSNDIVLLRSKKHLTPLEVAVHLSLPIFTYLDYEAGRKEIPENIKKRIFEFLSA
jgi:hypothetical protein